MTVFDDLEREDAAYWLGVLFADGCLHYRQNRKTYSLSLGLKEGFHVERFKTFLDAYPAISYYPKKDFYVLSVGNKELCLRLLDLGMVPRKSLVLKFPRPHLPKSAMRHFIRGCFDGDGCISIKKGKRTDRLHFHYVGSEDMVRAIQEIFVRELGISKTSLTKLSKVWNLHITKKEDINKIYDYLYSEATVFLERKKRVFETDLTQRRIGLTSGQKGVCFDKTRNNWRASFYEQGRRKEKRFQSEAEAILFLKAYE